jgi:hypothetical protein
MRLVLQELGDRTRAPLDQHLDGAVGQLQQLQHIGQHADAVHPVEARILGGVVDLRDQQDRLVVAHHRLERAHRLVASHEQRHDHVGKDHHVAQRQDGIGVGLGHSVPR